MVIQAVALFLAGLFCANGIPHFVNGISGRDFHNPFLHRFVPAIPSPLFNVTWGLLSFGLALVFLNLSKLSTIVVKPEAVLFALGFVIASIGLSILFHRRSQTSAG